MHTKAEMQGMKCSRFQADFRKLFFKIGRVQSLVCFFSTAILHMGGIAGISVSSVALY
jgi:hypothetical protein